MNYRHLRVAKLLQAQLSTIVFQELEFEDALVTLSGVEVDPGLETARVKISVFPETAAPFVLTALEKAKRRLQYLLLKKVNIKPMPRIVFEIDRTERGEDALIPPDAG